MPLLGNSLPGNWRPFVTASPWNTPIPASPDLHPDSGVIMEYMRTKSDHLAMSRNYTIPVYVVDFLDMVPVHIKSDRIFDFWDPEKTGMSVPGVPLTAAMWPEQTADGHICIVDPKLGVSWEMSRYWWGIPPTCTTFNLWNLRLYGYGNPHQGDRWTARGGRGSGFPLIPGLLRREEIALGSIDHALVFTFPDCRKADDGSKIFIYPPACRSDGTLMGRKYPIQGMRFQLDPTLDESSFMRMGISREARIVARTLQRYGMYLGDKGGAWKIQPQLLDKTIDGQVAAWGGLYEAVEKIPTDKFRIVQTGPATVKKG